MNDEQGRCGFKLTKGGGEKREERPTDKEGGRLFLLFDKGSPYRVHHTVVQTESRPGSIIGRGGRRFNGNLSGSETTTQLQASKR